MRLIVGATGVLGRETAHQLLASGHKVRGLTRHPDAAADLKELGAEIVQGDLIDPASLKKACQGVDAVLAAAHIAVIALTDPKLKNRTIEMCGCYNVTKNQIAEIYGRFSGKKPKVTHVMTAVMRVMAPVLRPVQPVISHLMFLSVWGDTTDQTFDPGAMLHELPMTLTRVEDFIRAQVVKN